MFLILANDMIINVCSFLDTRNMLNLCLTCNYLYKYILGCKNIMVNKNFTLKECISSLNFIAKLSYKIYNLSIACNKKLGDKDFENLKGIHTLNMEGCKQKTITDKAFENLKGIHTLNMSHCNQNTITDKAFEHLKGIRKLNISSCNKKITDKVLDCSKF